VGRDRYSSFVAPQDHEPVLNDDDALSLWVGRVARTHAKLEFDVDNVYRLLARRCALDPDGKALKGFEQRVKDCRTMLERSDADAEVRSSGDLALLAARNATVPRNRILHDMWLPGPLTEDSEIPYWNAFRRSGDLQQSYSSGTSHGLDVVVDAHTLLLRTRWRVSGLHMALHFLWPTDSNGTEPSRGEGELATYVSLMTDCFTLKANGGFVIA